jgi:peptidoglycan/LPS O-acetylase OafA/YrhL
MRFTALDALRGICSLIVVIFHIEAIGNIYAGSIHGIPFFEHCFLFVCFFFVLSGFVLTHTYFSKISTANELAVFVIRRFGRVYPLHLLFLILFIGLELAKLYAYSNGTPSDHAPFDGDFSIPAIFTNLLLVQSLNVHPHSTWNLPSWSISVEFYTYLVFALSAVFLCGRTRLFVVVSIGIAAFGATMVCNFSKEYINTVYDYAIFRCLYGFFCGAFTCIAMSKIRRLVIAPVWVFSFAEAATSLACIAFVADTGLGPQSMMAPLIFATAVAVFSFEKGWISSLLKKRPFQFFGDLSYTLYISHAFVLVMVGRIFRVLQHKTNYISTVTYDFLDAQRDLALPVSYSVSNVVVVGILVSIVTLSVVVNRWIEIPCRDYFGRIAKRFQHPKSAPQTANEGVKRDRIVKSPVNSNFAAEITDAFE